MVQGIINEHDPHAVSKINIIAGPRPDLDVGLFGAHLTLIRLVFI